ncbi:SDR family NAD(P)-dependent oxidoreductase [Dactylosporangium sp. NPDC049525]|uniref:SDR family NAD(P)-dependent oxidoreductase n=1 Tax=Dactylosporangium sp. NPDC049525 TaxID=3154730 RepID=UPI003432A7C8
MCSSSLTAIHLACESLRRGEASMALAGGVNLSVHPNKFATLTQGGFLSSNGRCAPFGDGGDGYVPGEGVGAVLLKPLDAALADGDRIWGVIKASAVGHGGRTNGYTVPDPVAQAGVVARAWSAAGVEPGSVGYVEAHGTGTALGDPIEVSGLARVFGGLAPGSVPIGSVKSNIGHAESAAGIAGLTKILLQLRHGKLAPSLHAEELNPHIDFTDSVFRVQRELADWPRATGTPRRAGLSSFGAGGANAHLVIEEPPAATEADGWRPAGPALVVLSAAAEDRLRETAQRLVAFAADDVDVHRVAYTLQTGREALAERLALRATDTADLRTQLQSYLDGAQGPWHRGSSRPAAGGLGSLLAGEDAQSMVARWIEQGRHDQLLQAWAHGLTVDWHTLYRAGTPQHVGLPAYPFARDRHWITPTGPVSATLHPLVHRNTSDFAGQRYTTRLTGTEFFLADHRIHNRPVLPAAASLEMARAAVEQALGHDEFRLADVTWVSPLIVDGAPVELHIELTLDDTGDRVAFQITRDGGDGEPVTHAHGAAHLDDTGPAPAPVDLAAARAGAAPVPVASCYAELTARGIADGPRMRGLTEVWAGDRQVIARVTVPIEAAGADPFVLHPSLLDAALQSGIALALTGTGAGAGADSAVPFSLGGLTIHGARPDDIWVHLRARDDADTFDIDLCDSQGRIWARLTGLVVRPIAAPAARTLLLERSWTSLTAGPAQQFTGTRVVLAGPLTPDLTGRLGGTEIIRLDDYETAAVQVLRRLQRATAPTLFQLLVTADPIDRLHGGLAAMLGSATQEDPRLRGQLLEIPAGTDAPAAAAWLDDAAARTGTQTGTDHLRVTDGGLETAGWTELPPQSPAAPWRDGGVYLITGGSGGLARLLLREISTVAPAATVILVSRSAPNPAGGDLGRAEYRQADVADRDAVTALIADVVATHGRLDGVVHAAGVLRDSLLTGKTPEQVAAVLAPKVAGVRHLDEATADLPLDLFLIFGSLAGAAGNPGQADYAAANAYLDRFAEHRAGLVAGGARAGCTLCVGWPLWADGGMGLAAETVRTLGETTGLVPLPTRAGLQALYQALNSGRPQVAVLHGDAARLTATIQPAAPTPTAAVPAQGDVSGQVVRYVAGLLASVIRVPVERLGVDEPLDVFGVDSIVALEVVRRLEPVFGVLPKTLLFEHRSVSGLAAYFVRHHGDRLGAVIGEPTAVAVADARRPTVRRAVRAPRRARTGDVAIVGLAGRYPQAGTIEEFWAALRGGRDLVTAVPADRTGFAGTAGVRGGFLDGVDEFDPLFFNIAPADAELLDPQERLFLQCAYETLQDAGYTRAHAAASGPVGVFVGVMYQEYQLLSSADQAVGGSSASIANRVSYFCGFEGPSVAVDTMCSSSLTAIHLACESLRRGEASMALAGGVNLSVHPNKFATLGQGGFLSTDGRCASFGDGGDGYVPGEGVGAVLLKPLDAALADGDQIWGVIKASAVGHGGRTNGYTVPDPTAQADVVRRAWSAAGVDPGSVGYVEAHGTGTALGDPIELAGLAHVFGGLAPGSVPVGSVKSNIGHSESAAGIAGLTKVLLQLRHAHLAPSLHAEVLNPHIDFTDSPFRVQRDLAAWPRVPGKPRRAGVSSFGAGGANAHLVIEEPPAATEADGWRPAGPALVVLSAADEDRLREAAQRLATFATDDVDVHRVAYTLQTGREAMTERLALRATDSADLRRQLRSYLDGAQGPWHRAAARPGAGGLGSLLAGEDAQAMVGRWIEQGRHDQLLQAWVHGLGIDWSLLYPAGTPRHVSLPAYPFARDRYWVALPQPAAGTLHPLVHRNVSTIWQQRFETTLTGAEFVLADHRVHDRPVLPAAAAAEMAYVAVTAALAPPAGTQVRLTDLMWQRPLTVPEGTAALTVQVDVDPHDDDTLTVALRAMDAADEPAYLRATAHLRAVETVPPLDPAGLLARCTRPLPADDGYARLRAAGIVHGPTMRALRELHAGDGEAVARIELPAGRPDDRFVLHPALLDAALQAAVALAPATAADPGAALTPAVPFGLEELAVHAPLPEHGWVWVRARATAAGRLLDIDVAADDGRVCARLRGLELRQLTPTAATLLLTPAWSPVTGTVAPAEPARTRLVLASERVPDLTGALPDARHARLTGYDDGAATAVALIQQLPAGTTPVIQLVVTDEPADGLLGGLHGILLTAQQEDPRVWCQLLEVPATADARTVGRLLEEFRHLPSGARVRVDPDGPRVAGWRELPPGTPPAMTWRDGGVYLITGGRGGLGRLLLAEIRRRVATATVVLVGRGTPETGDLIDGDGVRVDHRQADVADRGAMTELVAAVVARYGRLDGVVHAAGVLRDALLPHKTPGQIAAVLAAKVSGARHLDEATAGLPLDWFVLFGSITGVAGNPGQADYAAGNAFLDRFAEYRAGLVARGERSGHTLCVDWPLWTDGGMTVDAGRLPGLADRTGFAPLPPAEGMRALDRALAAGVPQVMVLYGDPARLRAAALPAPPTHAPEPGRPSARLERLLIAAAAGILGVEPADLDPDTDLAEYGFEPIMFAELTERLNVTHGLGLDPALLLQHPTLAGLSRRLAGADPALIGATEGGGRADG